MRKLLLSAFVTLALTFGAQAQTNFPPVPPTGTLDTNIVGTIGAGEFLGTVWDTLVGQGLTNLSATVYGTYTPSLKDWGYGVVLFRNLNLGGGFGAGIGVGVDQYQSQWYGLTAQATVKADTAPFSGWGTWGKNVIITPFAGLALGTPFGSSTSGTAGNLETIAFTGASVHLFKALGGAVALDGIYGTRTGLGGASGIFYGGGLSWVFMF